MSLWIILAVHIYISCILTMFGNHCIYIPSTDPVCRYLPLYKKQINSQTVKQGPSIYDVHTEGVRLRWTHVDGGEGGQAPCGRPHRKLKLESTGIILSSSHVKKLMYFLPEFSAM